MAKVQCKICGGQLELDEYVPSAECPYCGTITTFPKVSDSQKENLYNRAEHFRQNNEFDRALAQYEKIIELDASDPEIYWGMTLCRFGIEYVEDPASHQRVPTCHRVQYDSILSDSNYQLALEYADYSQRALYEAEAEKIANIQRSILAISRQEKPFDVFICYKESTDGGSRTKDSAIAQDIYYQLTNSGLKVFFARITLEDKLGQQYEPYIFAALNSAKVMLVIGTKPEYFDAVWVKNEWLRYLELLKKDSSRLLIPCYKDMNVYDIPDALSMLQAQDMAKIGFIQDLLRGIDKVLKAKPANERKAAVSEKEPINSQVDAWLRRVSIFLSNEEWSDAGKYCEKVLDVEPENATAYLLKTLVEFGCTESALYKRDFTTSKNFALAKKFATGVEKEKIAKIIEKRASYLKLIELHGVLNYARTVEHYNSLLAQCKAITSLPQESEDLCAEIQQILDSKIDVYNQAGQYFQEEKYLQAKKLYKKLDDFESSTLMTAVCTFRILILETTNFSSEYFVQQAHRLVVQFCEITPSKGMEKKNEFLYSFAQELESYHLEVALLFYQIIPKEYQDVNEKINALAQKIAELRQQIADKIENERKLKIKIAVITVLCIILMLSIGSCVSMYVKHTRRAEQARIEEAHRASFFSEINKNKQAIAFMLPGNVEMKMLFCPAGQFNMGSPGNETGRDFDETLHEVTISKAFFIGQYEVTQQQYQAVMDKNPSFFKGQDLPVESVSWDEANEFCSKLNAFYGLSDEHRFCLPTEAQWEYACRAGTTTAFHYGDSLYASMANFGGGKTTAVGRFQSNAWGLYDMHGNVREWCQDWYAAYGGDETDPKNLDSGFYHVIRGGGWNTHAKHCRSACRNHWVQQGNNDLGFRLVLLIP